MSASGRFRPEWAESGHAMNVILGDVPADRTIDERHQGLSSRQ
jgi:hypothetical protein